jgi:hypothetical protein
MVRLIPYSTAVGAIFALSSAARAADIDTSLGGFVKLDYGGFESAHAPLKHDGEVLDGETHLEIDGQTDTGVTYGGRLQLLPAAKAGDNGTYVSAAWAWGEFRLGDYSGAAKELSVSAPTVGIGQIAGDLDRFGGPSALIAPYDLNQDDSTKLTYLSPSILGIRLGLSYTPELSGGGVEIVPQPHIAGIDRHRNVTEFALNASRDYGDATVTLGAAYVYGTATEGSHLHDLSGASAGAKVAWNGFTAGGGFVYDGANTLPPDPRAGHAAIQNVIGGFDFGLSYETGRWGFAASWAHEYRKAQSANDIAGAGVVYRVISGVTVAADIDRFTAPAGPGRTASTALIMRTAVSF